MGRELTPAELAELLAAHALDALDGDEREQVEAWIARHPDARREADELRETASLLAYAPGELPPDLWSRIEQRLGDAPPPLRLAPVGDLAPQAQARARPTRRSWLVAVAAVVALGVAVAVGVVAARQNSDQNARLDQITAGMHDDAMHQAAMSAAMEPGARVAQLATDDGTVQAKVVTTADGHGYFMDAKLPTLPDGRTYQLWALMGDDSTSPAISVSVLGPDPTIRAFTTDAHVMGYAVTEEDAPGVTVTTQPMMLEGWLV